MQSLNSSSCIRIESEIASLKKVLIHTPGPEVECMSPKDVEKYLFHGVIFLKDLLEGYNVFKNVLSSFAQVFEIKQCLEEVFANQEAREFCLRKILTHYGKMDLEQELMSFDSQTLTRFLIEGYKIHQSPTHHSLASYISEEKFALLPLPNLYFTRDTSVVVGDKYISAHMATAVRFTETILTQTIFKFHPAFQSQGPLLNLQYPFNDALLQIEGGDVHVWSKDLYLLGLSVRTNAPAIDAFVDSMVKFRKANQDDAPFTVLAIFLPKMRTMIHLDMIFTRISEDQALAYAPAVTGAHPYKVIKISVTKKGEKTFETVDNLLVALKSVNTPIEPVFAGGKTSLKRQQRAQWMSGTNSFAVAPGKIICYENEDTLNELNKSGFKIVTGKNFLRENLSPSDLPDKTVISIDGSQLSQGGGGPRCMTCPIERV